MRHHDSVTGRCLAQPLKHPLMRAGRGGHRRPRDAAIEIVGASMHNLRSLDVPIPLGRAGMRDGVFREAARAHSCTTLGYGVSAN